MSIATGTVDGISSTPATWAIGSPSSVTITIRDNDHLFTLSGPSTIAEGAAATYTITRTGPVLAGTLIITINYTAGTASDADIQRIVYSAGTNPVNGLTSGNLPLFTAGTATESEQTFTITTADDSTPEPGETFTIALAKSGSRDSEIDIDPDSATGLTVTIVDDDGYVPTYNLAITGPATLTETDSDFMSGNYTVTRTGDEFTESTTVNIAVTHTTTSDADITVPASVTFAAGDDTETFQVTVRGDALNEAAEMFSLQISGAGLTPGAAHAVTITDNDDITVSIERASGTAATVDEGGSAAFTVTLAGATAGSAAAITVPYTVASSGSYATRNFGGDSGSITIAPGATEGTITLRLGHDMALDSNAADQTLTVTLTADDSTTMGTDEGPTAGPGGGAVARSGTSSEQSATVMVNFLDAARTLTVTGAATHAETDADSALTYTVALGAGDMAFAAATTVTWTVTPGTASAADFAALTGTLQFPAATTFAVTVIGDDLSEGDETFSVQVAVADASADGGTGYGAAADTTITDDDAISGMSMTLRGPATVNEERSAEFTVDLGAVVTGSSVTVMIAADAASTAAVTTDYTLSATSLTIAANARSATFTVTTTDGGGDNTEDRTLTLTATADGGANTAAMAAVSRTVTITEDDPAAREARLEAPLASAGRGVGQLAAQAVAGRLAAAVSGAGGANSLTIAGREFTGTEALAAEFLAGGYATGDREISADELLRGSGFNLTGGDGGRGLNFWGSGDFVAAEGDHDGVDYDGDTSAFTLGIDTNWRDGLVGVAVSRSDGDTDFTVTADGMKSTLETTVTTVHPYLTRRFNRSQLWLTAGAGSGDAELKEPDTVIKTDISVTTAAIGVNHIIDAQLNAGLSALYTRAELDDATGGGRTLPATTADSLRVAASGQARWTHGAWSPYLDFTVRHDSGDGDTGIAGDVGGGIEFRAPTVVVRLTAAATVSAEAAEESRAALLVRKSSGDFDLGLNLGADGDGVDTGRLVTGEWRF